MSDNAILLKGIGTRKEALAATALILPGHVLEYTAAGKFQGHSVAGGNMSALVAIEDDLQGRTKNDLYAVDEQVQAQALAPGDEVYVRLKDGETAVINSLLESAGDGTLQVHVPDVADEGADSASDTTTIYTNQLKFQAMEALDLSSSSGADPSYLLHCVVV